MKNFHLPGEGVVVYNERLPPISSLFLLPLLLLLLLLLSFVKVRSSLWYLLQPPISSLVRFFTSLLLFFALRSQFLARKSFWFPLFGPHSSETVSNFLETVSFPFSFVLICCSCLRTFEASQIFLKDLTSQKVTAVPAVQNFSNLHRSEGLEKSLD